MSDDPLQNEPGQTPIEESERRDLKPSLFSRAELNELEWHSTNAARKWALSLRVLKRDDILSDGFSRELHRRMFHRVWRWAGRYRTTARNLGWEPHRIPEGVRNALDDARYWLNNGTYPVAAIAIRLHHRLVVVHPWCNGNGRHARLLADALMAARGEKALAWGGDPNGLLGQGNLRRRYLEALRAADAHDFGPLLAFCR